MTQPELKKRQTAASQRMTGETFCANGGHYVPSSQIVRRKPTVCARCAAKIAERMGRAA